MDAFDPAAFDLSRLHAETTGPEGAPPLLVLHGWGSSALMMRPVADVLADRFRVYNVDLPGHGRTPAPPAPWGVPEYAALVARYLAGQRIAGPIPAVGHSNGGRILLYMASEDAYAGLFSRLVLVSPSGVTPRRGAGYHARRVAARALKAPFELLPDGAAKDFGLDWLRHSLVWRALGSSDYNRLTGTMRGTFVRTVGHHLDDRLGRIAAPVLVLWGDRDEAVSRYQMDVLTARVPDAGLVVLDGAGHYGYLDRMDLVEAAARAFLAEAPEAAPSEAEPAGVSDDEASTEPHGA